MIITETNERWLELIHDLKVCNNAVGAVAFGIFHNYNTIYEKIASYIDIRNKIVESHGTLGEDGTYTVDTAEQIAAAKAELAEYSEIESSLDIVLVPESAIITSHLTVAQVNNISWMFKSTDHESAKKILGTQDEEKEEEKKDAEPSDEGKPYDPSKPIDDERFI